MRNEAQLVKKIVRKYKLQDTAQDSKDKEFWVKQSYEEKLKVLERLRTIWQKMNPNKTSNGDPKRFRRVFRIVKQA